MAKNDNSQLVAILSYITLIGWIIALILHLNDKTSLGGFHVRQALMVMLVGLVLGLIPIINLVAWIVVLIFWIMGLISAIQGKEKELPLIGAWAQNWFKGI